MSREKVDPNERLKELSGGGKVTPEAMQVMLLIEISDKLTDLDDMLKSVEDLTRFKTVTLPSVRNFPKPRQSKNVPVAKRVLVWKYKVPEKMIAIIDRVANDWQKDFIAEWLVDGQSIEEDEIERRLGSFSEPLKLEPVMLAQNKIEWFYTNNSAADKEMSVVLEGRLIRKEELVNILKDS